MEQNQLYNTGSGLSVLDDQHLTRLTVDELSVENDLQLPNGITLPTDLVPLQNNRDALNALNSGEIIVKGASDDTYTSIPASNDFSTTTNDLVRKTSGRINTNKLSVGNSTSTLGDVNIKKTSGNSELFLISPSSNIPRLYLIRNGGSDAFGGDGASDWTMMNQSGNIVFERGNSFLTNGYLTPFRITFYNTIELNYYNSGAVVDVCPLRHYRQVSGNLNAYYVDIKPSSNVAGAYTHYLPAETGTYITDASVSNDFSSTTNNVVKKTSGTINSYAIRVGNKEKTFSSNVPLSIYRDDVNPEFSIVGGYDGSASKLPSINLIPESSGGTREYLNTQNSVRFILKEGGIWLEKNEYGDSYAYQEWDDFFININKVPANYDRRLTRLGINHYVQDTSSTTTDNFYYITQRPRTDCRSVYYQEFPNLSGEYILDTTNEYVNLNTMNTNINNQTNNNLLIKTGTNTFSNIAMDDGFGTSALVVKKDANGFIKSRSYLAQQAETGYMFESYQNTNIISYLYHSTLSGTGVAVQMPSTSGVMAVESQIFFETKNTNDIVNKNSGKIFLGASSGDGSTPSGDVIISNRSDSNVELEFRSDDTTLSSPNDWLIGKIQAGFTSGSYTSAYFKFQTHHANNTTLNDTFELKGSNATLNGTLYINQSSAGIAKIVLQDQTDHDDIDLLFQGWNGSNLIDNAVIRTENNYLNFETLNNSPMNGIILKTNSTNAITIDNNQNVELTGGLGIGKTVATGYALDVDGTYPSLFRGSVSFLGQAVYVSSFPPSYTNGLDLNSGTFDNTINTLTLTQNRSINFPDNDGTVALTNNQGIWSSSGNDISYTIGNVDITNRLKTGSLGIGVNPATGYVLDVFGNAIFRGLTTFQSSQVIFQNKPDLYLGANFLKGSFSTELNSSTLTANRTISLPDQDGELLIKSASGLSVDGAITSTGSASELSVVNRSTNVKNWTLYSPSTGNFHIYNQSSGANAFTINSSNYVGVNQTSPSGFLDIGGTNNTMHLMYKANGSEDTYIRGGKTTSSVYIADLGSKMCKIGNNGSGTPNATLQIDGYQVASYFDYGTSHDTYIRGGATLSSNVYINDYGSGHGVGILTNSITSGYECEILGSTYLNGNNNRINRLSFDGNTPNTYINIGGSLASNLFGIQMVSNSSENKHYAVGQSSGNNAFLAWAYNSNAGSAYASLSTYGGNNHISLQNDGGNVGIQNNTPSSRLSFSNSVESKICLYGTSSAMYGFGISASQLNYHVMTSGDRHVWYAGGTNGNGTELARIQGNGNMGVGTNAPNCRLHIRGGSGSAGYTGGYYGTQVRIEDNNKTGVYVNTPADNSKFAFYAHGTSFDGETTSWRSYGASRYMAWQVVNGIQRMTLTTTTLDVPGTSVSFTGGHKTNIIKDNNDIEKEDLVGLIVVSNGKYIPNGDKTQSGTITINNAWVETILSSKPKQKNIFGVFNINHLADSNFYDSVNSVGEGGIWIVDENGDLENGDYITTSSLKGYGMKQDNEFLCNYTVGKITCECIFNTSNDIMNKKKYSTFINDEGEVECNLDENGNRILEDKLDEEGNVITYKRFKTRYLLQDSTQITEEEYNTRKAQGETVYRACFVGCTYHCA